MTSRATEIRLRRLEHAATRGLPQDRATIVAQIITDYRRLVASYGSHEAVVAGLGRISAAAAEDLTAMHRRGELA